MNQIHTNRPVVLLAAFMVGVFVFAGLALGQVINEDRKFLPNDGAVGDDFGWSVAIDKGIVAIGAPNDDDKGTDSGSAYLYDASTGTLLAKLLPEDGVANDQFGWSIAIDNGIVAVGAWRNDDNGSLSGSAYLFNTITGTQIAKLLPDDGSANDRFGWSIAISNGVVAIGAHRDDVHGTDSGSAYIFDAATGDQIVKLVPSDGAPGDFFGNSIAISDNIVIIGAYGDDNDTGSAYLFDASTGTQLAKLLTNDRDQTDRFGRSVGLDNGIAVVGAWSDEDNGADSGSAYLFNVSTGVQIAKLLPNDGAAFDEFGFSVAISNGVVAVGVYRDDDNGPESGSALLFNASTGEQLSKLLPSDGAAGDWFGHSVTIDNDIVAVGAHRESNSGSTYIFDVNCEADLTGDGVTDTLDFLLFLGAYATSDPLADWNKDSQINTLDFLAYLSDWAVGCF